MQLFQSTFAFDFLKILNNFLVILSILISLDSVDLYPAYILFFFYGGFMACIAACEEFRSSTIFFPILVL